MSEEKKETKIEEKEAAVVEQKETDMVLSRAYKFEGQTYEKLDLSGMEDLTAQDMIDASRYMRRIGFSNMDEEMDLPYALFMASRITGLPIEFFNALKPYDAIRIRGRMLRFFYNPA